MNKTHIFKINSTIEAMILKLDIWKKYVHRNDVQWFKTLKDFLTLNEIRISKTVQSHNIHIIGFKIHLYGF